MSPRTEDCYVRAVARFSEFFGRSPARLGPAEIELYLLFLRDEKRVSWCWFNQTVCALRFFYQFVMQRPDVVTRIPYGKREKHLPVVLSQDELVRFLGAITNARDRVILTLLYSAGLRLGEALVARTLRGAFDDGSLTRATSLVADRTALDLLLARASATKWHVYVKPPFGGPEHVLGYLAGYTYRIGISNHRILAFDGTTVTFSYRDAADGDAQKTMALPATEFLRRFLLHVLPKGLVRIRAYGFLANRDRHENIARARKLIGSDRIPEPRPETPNARLCPHCGEGTMIRRADVPPERLRTWFDTS